MSSPTAPLSSSTRACGACGARDARGRCVRRRARGAARRSSARGGAGRTERLMTLAALADAEVLNDDDDDEGEGDDDDDDESRALGVLQWRELTAQVRAHACTARGRATCGVALELGGDVERSRTLLAQTTAALRVGLEDDDFVGAKDVRMAVRGAENGRVLSGFTLSETFATCATQKALGRTLERFSSSDADVDDAFWGIERALSATPGDLMGEIARCVACPGGKVLDEASETLARIRSEQRDIREELKRLLNDTSREMARKNFAERAQIVTRLGRQCIPMKLGSAGELPGVVLDVSGTGNTVFKEPSTAVPLNNALTTLAAEEEAEEERILSELTAMVATYADILLAANDALAELDAANARARHARWLDGAAPTIVSVDSGIEVRQLQHPLLLERYLAPLPQSGSNGDDGAEAVEGWAAEAADVDAQAEDGGESETSTQPRREIKDVVPVDFNVDASIRTVAITGPNTGGKTASLKAIGIASLMARAGLYLPCDDGCRVPWFKRVIADLGDSQTLELDGGLSTFGAHLKSLQRILNAADADTLVLLDEPGSGTDPAEGAALAVAVLNKLSRTARLTVATSHYEDVKTATLASAVAQVAAVEFNLRTLQPTYRLLWGETGESNALHIAAGLGLSKDLITEAREALAKADAEIEADASGDAAREKRAILASALGRESEVQTKRRAEAAMYLSEARALLDDVKTQSAHLDLRQQMIKVDIENSVKIKLDEARELMAACETREELDEVARASLPDGWVIDASGEAAPGATSERAAFWSPEIGSKVIVRQLGSAEAEVIDVHVDTNEITVKLGTLTTRTSLASGVSPVKSKVSWQKR